MKPNHGNENTRRRRQREAADWIVSHESADERIDKTGLGWVQWSADTHNCAEYNAMVQVAQLLRSHASVPQVTDAELLYDADDDLPEPPPETDQYLDYPRSAECSASFERRAGARKAAAILLPIVGVIAGVLVMLSHRSPNATETRYATNVGEQRKVELSDGTTVLLEGSSSLTVRFSAQRDVYLDRGGARFLVSRDPHRPFFVHSTGGVVQVVGTEFVVHRYSRRVRVWVAEGAVELLTNRPVVKRTVSASALDHGSVLVTQGQEIAFDASGYAGPPVSVDQTVIPDETPGMFLYRSRPLAEVVEDIQRYSLRKITIDPLASEFLYSGSVFQRDVDQWLKSLPEIFPDLIIEDRAGAVSIRSRLTSRIDPPQSARR